jgi:dihydroneopterin aldolase
VASDTIYVRGLETRAILGVACDAARAAARDDLADAVNYRTLSKAALAFVSQSRYRLVETLAERLAEHLMSTCSLPWIRLRVSKPGAIRFSRDVGVEIERGRRP